MKNRKINFVLVLLIIFIAGILSGCLGDKTATPSENASVVAENATKTYFDLYDQYKRLEFTLTGENLDKLKKVAPVLNKAKRHLAAYNDLVIQWRESGDEPMGLMESRRLLNAALAQASSLLLEFL